MYPITRGRRITASSASSFAATLAGLFMALIVMLAFDPGLGWASQKKHSQSGKPGPKENFVKARANCSTTAYAAFKACGFEINEEYWMAVGICANLSDPEAVAECIESARQEKRAAKRLCREVREARLDVCDDLGQAPYDPVLRLSAFLDSEAITPATANPFFPLIAGTQWVYEGATEEGTEVITVTVTDIIKDIEYPAESGQFFACVVVRDVVELDGELIEDTDDWYAQDLQGNVWYFGEISKNYEDGELVGIDGSWKAGVEGAIPGIVMLANPQAGDLYRQEYALGEAEDMATVISRGEDEVGVPYGVFSADIIRTGEFTPLDPEVYEFKYYAPGVGMVLEVNPETGERVELVEKMVVP